jgi:signal transduction histidine kinase
MGDHDTADPVTQSYARLLSIAVHDFRTPASVVGGYLRMLQRDADQPLGERQRKMVDMAAESCARLVALINELSEVSKLDSGTAVIKRESFDLFQLIRDMAAGVHEAADREVHLDVRGDAAGARMTGDPARIQAAFHTFFMAILREQPSRTMVAAECRRASEGSAIVVVAPDADVQRSYDAAAAPFDEKRGGIGLALAIACRVIARHGGRVWSPDLGADGDGPHARPAGRSALLVSLPISEQLS